MGRLTDNDKTFGPFTFGRTTWSPIRLILESNGDPDDDDQDHKSSLTIQIFKFILSISLGNLIKPVVYKVKPVEAWDEATVKRMKRDYYLEYFKREYGFSLNEGFLQVYFGMQTDGSIYNFVDKDGYICYTKESDKVYKELKGRSWSTFLPWTQDRLTEYRVYDDKNNLFYAIKDNDGIQFKTFYDEFLKCPKGVFLLRDFDGTVVRASAVIEEKVYLRGEKSFKWISFFFPAKKYRMLNIEFDQEVGPEKGSYKGGVGTTSFRIPVGTTLQEAMQIYCESVHSCKNATYRMCFIGKESAA